MGKVAATFACCGADTTSRSASAGGSADRGGKQSPSKAASGNKTILVCGSGQFYGTGTTVANIGGATEVVPAIGLSCGTGSLGERDTFTVGLQSAEPVRRYIDKVAATFACSAVRTSRSAASAGGRADRGGK